MYIFLYPFRLSKVYGFNYFIIYGFRRVFLLYNFGYEFIRDNYFASIIFEYYNRLFDMHNKVWFENSKHLYYNIFYFYRRKKPGIIFIPRHFGQSWRPGSTRWIENMRPKNVQNPTWRLGQKGYITQIITQKMHFQKCPKKCPWKLPHHYALVKNAGSRFLKKSLHSYTNRFAFSRPLLTEYANKFAKSRLHR